MDMGLMAAYIIRLHGDSGQDQRISGTENDHRGKDQSDLLPDTMKAFPLLVLRCHAEEISLQERLLPFLQCIKVFTNIRILLYKIIRLICRKSKKIIKTVYIFGYKTRSNCTNTTKRVTFQNYNEK